MVYVEPQRTPHPGPLPSRGAREALLVGVPAGATRLLRCLSRLTGDKRQCDAEAGAVFEAGDQFQLAVHAADDCAADRQARTRAGVGAGFAQAATIEF